MHHDLVPAPELARPRSISHLPVAQRIALWAQLVGESEALLISGQRRKLANKVTGKKRNDNGMRDAWKNTTVEARVAIFREEGLGKVIEYVNDAQDRKCFASQTHVNRIALSIVTGNLSKVSATR